MGLMRDAARLVASQCSFACIHYSIDEGRQWLALNATTLFWASVRECRSTNHADR
jgi:hypothetical protein